MRAGAGMMIRRTVLAAVLGTGLLACGGDDPADGGGSDASGSGSGASGSDDSTTTEEDEGGGEEGSGGGGTEELAAGACDILRTFLEEGETLQEDLAEFAEADISSVEEGEEAIAALRTVMGDLQSLLETAADDSAELDPGDAENGEAFVEALEAAFRDGAGQVEGLVGEIDTIDLENDPGGAVVIGETLQAAAETFQETFEPLQDEQFAEITGEIDSSCEV